MVDSTWTFTITHYDKSAAWASQDISDDAFPRLFTDTGDGKVNAATIRIIADGGEYITTATKTKIDLNDRIRLQADDGTGVTYNRVFDIIKLVPIKSKGEGVMLELQCLGIERWLQQVQYSRRVWSETPKEIFDDLVEQYQYNVAQSTELPQINTIANEILLNELPTTIKLHNDFGTNEDTIFNRMNQLIDQMSSPQASGGILDFFDIRFVSSVSNVTSFDIEVFSSGNPNRSKPSVTINGDGADSNLEEGTDGGLDEVEGTIINNWGANGQGTLPIDYSQFKSRNLEMPTNLGSQSQFAEWSVVFEYDTGAVIKYTLGSVDLCYKRTGAKVVLPPSTPDADGGWTALTTNSYYGDIQYSPWTDGKATEWNNGAGDPENTGPLGRCMFDANIIINGDEAFRSWADVIELNPSSIDVEWLYSDTTLYDGLRVLVKGTGTGAFTGFDHHIMAYDIKTETWISKYELVDDFMIAVIGTGEVFRYDGGSSYTDMSGEHNGLDCFHPLHNNSVFNDVSSIQDLSGGSVANYDANVNSAVVGQFRYVPLKAWVDEWGSLLLSAGGVVGGLLNWVWRSVSAGGTSKTTDDWYSAGAWLSMRFPFPRSSYGAGDDVGSMYGGTASGNIVPYLDTQNMTFSRGGVAGWNNGILSEDLGQISSVDFRIKTHLFANLVIGGGDETMQKANFKMAMYLGDKNDNVVKQNFVVGFNNQWTDISLGIDSFEQYRGRVPIYESTFIMSAIIPPKELPNISQFRWHEVAWMVIQCEESYSNEGRFRGASGNELGTGDVLFNSQLHNYMQFDLHLDALRFGKPLLANSGQALDQHKSPDFIQSPDIETYHQLQNNCAAELEKAQFQKKQYDIITEGDFSIEYGDFFLFDDDDIVFIASPNANEDTNKIELVAKHIEYTFSKGDGGPGGYKRRIIGAKRFT